LTAASIVDATFHSLRQMIVSEFEVVGVSHSLDKAFQFVPPVQRLFISRPVPVIDESVDVKNQI
jgi:hypothetical protein